MSNIVDKVNGYSIWLRLIHPILTGIVGALILMQLTDVKDNQKELKAYFVNHLYHHQDLEIGFERRMATTDQRSSVNEQRILRLEDCLEKQGAEFRKELKDARPKGR